MIIAGIYSFKGGKETVEANYAAELAEIKQVIAAINLKDHRTKVSKEKTMPGKMLYNPRSLNAAVKHEFAASGWQNYRVACEYSTEYYTDEYHSTSP